jgi:AcrR family transcriptional regulator
MVQVNKRSGVKTKEKVLNAAVKVFSAHGYQGASIRAIAKTAGISIGGVYLYFRNKEELYLNLIKDRVGEQVLLTKEKVALAGSPEDGLRAFLSLHLEYGIKNKELILINIREHGFAFGKEIKRKFLRSQIELLTKVLKNGITEGVFRACNTEEAARIIMSTLRGVVLSMALDGESAITEKGLGDLIILGLSRVDKEACRKKLATRAHNIAKNYRREN